MIERSYIEYYTAYHCNLRCANCSVGSPFIPPTYSKYEEFVRDVDNLRQYMHVGVIRFLGGEPTLNPDLVDYLKYAKSSGFADTTCLGTNGIKLLSMSDEFWEHCDIIHISVYKNVNINYDKIFNIMDKKNVRWMIANHPATTPSKVLQHIYSVTHNDADPDRRSEFRILDQYERHDEETAQTIYQTCPSHVWNHTFADGKYYRCGHSIHRNFYYDQIGVEIPDLRLADGIPIDENFEENYAKHEASKTRNIDACLWCKGNGDGYDPVNVPHRQLP